MYSPQPAPRRPGIPQLFPFCILSLISARLVFSRAFNLPWFLISFVGVGIAVLAFYWTERDQGTSFVAYVRKQPLLIVGAASVLLISLLSEAGKISQDRAVETLRKTPVSSLQFVAEGDATEGDSGFLVKAKAYLNGEGIGLVRISLPEDMSCQEVFEGTGTVAKKDDEYARSLFMQGYVGQIKLAKILKKEEPPGILGIPARIKKEAIGLLQPEETKEKALIAGMCLGYKPALKKSGIQENFSAVGLAHVIAVSGAHLAIVGSALGVLLSKVKLSSSIRILLLCGICALYVLICGAPIAAQRSWLMTVVGNGAVLFGRRNSSLNSLSLAALGLVAMRPSTAADMGFLLSFTSVAALALFSNYAASLLRRGLEPLSQGAHFLLRSSKTGGGRFVKRGCGKMVDFTYRRLVSDGSASLVCSCCSAPLSSSMFGRLCLVGPVSAVLVGPFIVPLMLCGLVAILVLFLPFMGSVFASVPLFISSFCAKIILFFASAMQKVPFGSINFKLSEPFATIALIGSCFLLYVFWPNPRKHLIYSVGIGLFILVFFVSSILPSFSPSRLVVLNVGQGDAILIQDRTHAVLVDTGPNDSVVDAMAPFFVTHLDAIIITHQHNDHYGGLQAILSHIPTDRIIFGKGVVQALCPEIKKTLSEFNAPLQEVAAGDVMQDGGWDFSFLWPKESSKGDKNEDSVCFSLRRSGEIFSAFLTGDAEEGVLEKIACLPKKVSVYKVGHHGSAIALNKRQAKELSPKLSVASAGRGNKYGHPTKQCIAILQEVGSQFVCTMDAGSVVTTPQKIGIGVSADVPEALRKRY